MRALFRRLIAGYAATWACVIVGSLVWFPVGDRLGRDFRPMAATAGLFILILGIAACRRFGWRFMDVLVNAVAAEITLLLVISYFSGSSGTELLHWFNIYWWAYLSPVIGLPWLAGYAAGCMAKRWSDM